MLAVTLILHEWQLLWLLPWFGYYQVPNKPAQ